MKTKTKFAGSLCVILALFLLFSIPASAASAQTVRLGGSDRYQTAAMISAAGWEKSDTVVLASAKGFADALAGVPLAYALDAPILLLDGKTLSPHTSAEITRLGATKIYILGGNASISTDIEKKLKTDGFTVTRVSGNTRFETAEKIADVMYDMGAVKSDTAFFAYAYNYPDALAVGSVAAMNGSPILYAPASGSISSGAAACLDRFGIDNAVVLGGTAAIGDDVAASIRSKGVNVDRIGGANRYETGLNISGRYANVFSGDAICFATGRNYPDALAGGVFAAKQSAPVVLVDKGISVDAVNGFVSSLSPETAYVFGGTSVLPGDLINDCLGTATPPTTTTTTTTTTTATTTLPTTSATTAGGDNDVYFIYADTIVYRANSSSKIFHRSEDCSSMASPIAIKYSEAVSRGLRPCRNCCANCIFYD